MKHDDQGWTLKKLEEFRALPQKHYGDLVDALEDKYCWKCPMRSTSSETFCREAEIWIRLSNAFEQSIQEESFLETFQWDV